MKRIASVAIGLGAIAITLIPVSAANTPTDQSVTPGIGRVGHLTFQGSTTVGPIIQAAASAYNTAKGSTIILNDTTNIVQNGSGFGQNAITLTIGDGAALGHIATDIGMSSGVVNTTTFSDVQSTAIARDGMVFIVNETSADWTGHKILNVTVGQIDDIYEGRVNNWNQITDPITGVVGPTLAIGVRAREIGSGTRNSWKDSVGLTQTDSDSSPAANTENYVIVNSGFGRLTAMADMRTPSTPRPPAANAAMSAWAIPPAPASLSPPLTCSRTPWSRTALAPSPPRPMPAPPPPVPSSNPALTP